MSEPYLIAHLVRGQPAFDIATSMLCTHCQTWDSATGARREDREEPYPPNLDCTSCEGTGFWFILKSARSDSGGLRAYPYYHVRLAEAVNATNIMDFLLTAPADHPDLYPEWPTALNKHFDDYTPESAKPGYGKITNLAERLGFVAKPPTITRR